LMAVVGVGVAQISSCDSRKFRNFKHSYWLS